MQPPQVDKQTFLFKEENVKKTLVWIFVAALVAFASAQTPPVSKVGSLSSFTGPLAEFGPAINNGVQLAADQINAATTELLGGPVIEIVTEDDATAAAQGVDRARKLVGTDGVIAIIGALSSGVSVAVAESVSIPSGVIQISPASTSPLIALLPDIEDYVFRTTASDTLQAVVGAQLARGEIIDGHSFSSAAIIYVNNPYGQGLADAFEAAFTARGGVITAKVAHQDEPQPTYASMLEQVLADGPGVVLAASYPGQASVYMAEARDLFGYTSWQFTDGTKSLDIVTAIGADVVDGLYGTAAGADPSWEGAATFEASYAEAYGSPPPLPYIDTGYDAMATIGLAIVKTIVDGQEVTSENVRTNLRAVSNPPGEVVGVADFHRAVELIMAGVAINYTGAAGEVDYDDLGDVVTPIEVWQYAAGTIVSVTVQSGSAIPAE
ncbi:MAG: ABC transporter substrate-binding protein [Trueperaceae bacterium]